MTRRFFPDSMYGSGPGGRLEGFLFMRQHGFIPGQPYTRQQFWVRIQELAAGRAQDMGALEGIFNGAYSGPTPLATALRAVDAYLVGQGVAQVTAPVSPPVPAAIPPAAPVTRRPRSLFDLARLQPDQFSRISDLPLSLATRGPSWGRSTLEPGVLYCPVQGAVTIVGGNFTSGFGARGTEVAEGANGIVHIPARGGGRAGRGHQGVDLYAPEGSIISAPGPGVILDVSTRGGLGRTVTMRFTGVQHRIGGETVDVYGRFAHTRVPRSGDAVVTAGQVVQVGQPMANVGSTGYVGTRPDPDRRDLDYSGWPHVHMELRIPRMNPSTGRRYTRDEIERAGRDRFYRMTEAINPLTQPYSRMRVEAAIFNSTPLAPVPVPVKRRTDMLLLVPPPA